MLYALIRWTYFISSFPVLFHQPFAGISYPSQYLALKLLQQKLISHSLQSAKLLVYAALAYYLLKFLGHTEMDELHIPFTFWSFVVTSVFAVICFFEPAFLLSISPLLLDESKKGKLSKVISLFLLLLVEKFKFMWEIQFILACSGIATGLLLLTLNLYLQLPVTLILHPLSMLLAAVVFIFLEFLNIAITSAKMALAR